MIMADKPMACSTVHTQAPVFCTVIGEASTKSEAPKVLKNPDCSVCLSGIETKEDKIKLGCGHAYHTVCGIKALLTSPNKMSCPLCRQVLDLESKIVVFDIMTKAQPSNPEWDNNLGSCLVTQGINKESGFQHLKKAVEKNHKKPVYWKNLIKAWPKDLPEITLTLTLSSGESQERTFTRSNAKAYLKKLNST